MEQFFRPKSNIWNLQSNISRKLAKHSVRKLWVQFDYQISPLVNSINNSKIWEHSRVRRITTALLNDLKKMFCWIGPWSENSMKMVWDKIKEEEEKWKDRKSILIFYFLLLIRSKSSELKNKWTLWNSKLKYGWHF